MTCLDAAPEGLLRFYGSLRNTFGVRLLRYLGLTYFGLKGVVFSLVTAAMLPYFQEMQVSGMNFQLASVVARIPWSMKGWVGVLSDCLPFGRYHKRGYLMLSSVVGVVGLAMLSTLQPERMGPDQVWFAAALFCLTNVLIATFDLLCEGKYSELMREAGAGSEVLTLVWSCMQSGALLGAVITGAMVDRAGPRPLLMVCLPIALLSLWRTFAGDLPEKPARSWRSLLLKVRSEPRLFLLAGAMAAGSLAVALSIALCGQAVRNAVTYGVSGALIVFSFLALPRTLARSNLYMFLSSVAYLDITGPLNYFYTGTTGCVEDAPHFSYSYYLAVSNIVGSAGAILGAALFQYMQAWSFRSAFYVTTCIQVVASVFDLLIVKRWNKTLFHLPDWAAYLFGDAACQSMATMMATMPMAMLTARLCPRGAEATVFAILAGFQNFGSSVGSVLGVQLSEALGVRSSADGPCDFGNLGSLIMLSHVLGPLLVLPFTLFLVPAARIDDECAFMAAPPPPSFASPAPSPPASPGTSPASSPAASPAASGDDPVGDLGDYVLMEEQGSLVREIS